MERNQEVGNLSLLLKILELVSGKAGIQAQIDWLQSL